MSRLFAVKNLGPAPSMEELATNLAQYTVDYEDAYEMMDRMDGGQSLGDFAYDSALQMIAGDPKDALVYLTSQRDLARVEGAIDNGQIPMLDRLIDQTKAYIAVRGL